MNPQCIFWYITSHGHCACNSALKSWSQSSLQKQECFNLQIPLCRVRTKYMYERNTKRWQYTRVQQYDSQGRGFRGMRMWGVLTRRPTLFFYTRIANSKLMQPW